MLFLERTFLIYVASTGQQYTCFEHDLCFMEWQASNYSVNHVSINKNCY